MTATLSSARSKHHPDLWPSEPPAEGVVHPIDLDRLRKRPPLRKRASRGLVRFVIIFGVGVAATLGWQSYGDAVRELIANASPQLGWLAPQAGAVTQAAPSTVGATAPAMPGPDLQQLATVSLDLAAMRQSLDQLAARQQQVADAIGRLQAAEQDILNKIAAPSPQPAAAAARKPVALTPPAR